MLGDVDVARIAIQAFLEDAPGRLEAIQEAQPTINADPLKCERDASGKCVKVNLCYGDYRSGASDCLAPAEPRAWSSPIYLTYVSSSRQ